MPFVDNLEEEDGIIEWMAMMIKNLNHYHIYATSNEESFYSHFVFVAKTGYYNCGKVVEFIKAKGIDYFTEEIEYMEGIDEPTNPQWYRDLEEWLIKTKEKRQNRFSLINFDTKVA